MSAIADRAEQNKNGKGCGIEVTVGATTPQPTAKVLAITEVKPTLFGGTLSSSIKRIVLNHPPTLTMTVKVAKYVWRPTVGKKINTA